MLQVEDGPEAIFSSSCKNLTHCGLPRPSLQYPLLVNTLLLTEGCRLRCLGQKFGPCPQSGGVCK